MTGGGRGGEGEDEEEGEGEEKGEGKKSRETWKHGAARELLCVVRQQGTVAVQGSRGGSSGGSRGADGDSVGRPDSVFPPGVKFRREG